MRALVARDRNHPSVTIWSFCNEAGCEGTFNQQGGPRFQRATYELDGSRPTLANMFTFGDLLSSTIDVQGFSHQSRQKLDECHAKLPEKPIYASECCSCNTMRDEDAGAGGVQASFNADCQQGQTNASNGADYAIGTMVWTLFDYYGEPSFGGWPFVSSTFGAFDLTGFAKAASYWFRSQWLYAIDDEASDKTFATSALGDESHMVHIVEHWSPPAPPPPVAPSMNKSYVAACDGTARQKFFPMGVNSSLPDDELVLKSFEGLCLSARCDLKATPSGCYPLSFVDCGDFSHLDPDLLLRTESTTGGELRAVNNGGCIDGYGGAGRGEKVGIYPCNGGDNQKWVVDLETSTVVSGETDPDLPGGLCLSTSPTDTVSPSTKRTIHVYSDAPAAELLLNGASMGIRPIKTALEGGDSWAEWGPLDWKPGELKAVARAANSPSAAVLATATVRTPGAPAKLELSLDVPSPLTGTGSALLLDGLDSGLVRAAIVDANGTVVHSANDSVTFRVTSGPGRIVGVHSGEPKSHEPTQSPTHSAYHGLVRAAIMVTSTVALVDRRLIQYVDVHGGHNALVPASAEPILVSASAAGLPTATIQIPTSLNAATDSVLAAAERYGSKPVLGFH
jgi:hypothetical protein